MDDPTPPSRPPRRAARAVSAPVIAVQPAAVFLAALVLAALMLAGHARAGASPPSIAQIVQAEIRPGWRGADGQHIAALHLRLAEGWRTYWRIPGQAGIAPQLDWSRSQNVASVTAHWPRPAVFDQDGYNSVGYAGELVLPLTLTPRDPARPMALVGDLTVGLCRDVCIPADLSVSQPLRGNGAHDPVIAAALERRPEPARAAGLSRATCQIRPDERGVELTLRITMPQLHREEHVVMELPGTNYWVSDSHTRRESAELVATARISAPQRGPVSISRDQLAFTIITPDRLYEHRGCTGG
ncbi:MAG: hypothetical protein JJT95_09885 [Pararhodobacter sp.]|nr:hypothetical protein [Pararhodobacter sp.]